MPAALALTAAALVAGGCGSGGSASVAEQTSHSAHGVESGEAEAAKPGQRHRAPFEVKGGDNSIQRFGKEAGAKDLRAAGAALHAYLDARAAQAWSRACSYLARGASTQLAQLSGSSGARGCAQGLAAFSALPRRALKEAAIAQIGALRRAGSSGFLLFHGARGAAMYMPMALEGGRWKVAAIAPSPLS